MKIFNVKGGEDYGKKGEFYLQWHITNRCANRCKHCYQKNYQGIDTDLETADFILKSLKKCCEELESEPYLVITGGDPFANPNFPMILEKARENCKKVGILGNPEPLLAKNKKIVNWLRDMNIFNYQLSLDGLEKTHNSIRSKGSFQRTIRAIGILRESGIWVNVMSTVSSENINEMVDVMKTAYSAGANFWSFSRYCPSQKGDCGSPGNIKGLTDIGITPTKYLSFMETIMKEVRPYEKNKSLQDREPLLCLVRNDDKSKIKGCGIGFSRLVVLPDRTVMACRRHPGSVLGKLNKKHSLLWFFAMHPKMDFYRDFSRMQDCINCQNILICRGCRAISFLANGNDYGSDPQCKIAKNLKRR